MIRRTPIAALVVLAAVAVLWRFTWGTTEALGDRAERDARSHGSVEATLKAEQEIAAGTGSAGYDNVVHLVEACHAAVRRKLDRFAHVQLDGGVPPDRGYIHTHEYRGIRYVGLNAEAPRAGSRSTGDYPALMPPLSGAYTVDGHVAYSSEPIEGGSPYEHRSYFCTVSVDGQRVAVSEVALELVR